MKSLSSPLDALQPHYPVVVVGSGYGAGVAASRLARAGQRVCVLERGREFAPGSFPDSFDQGRREMQFDTPKGRLGPAQGLFDFRINNDVNVVLGCGLGGTSLINANVSLEPEPGVLDAPHWPEGLRRDRERLREGFRRARAMLEPAPYPDSYPALRKLLAHEASARAMGRRFRRVPLNVAFEERVNSAGVRQSPCNLCGDCASGCNFGAKNTVQDTYLRDAHNHGAEIFTAVTVRHLERRDGRWVVHYRPTGTDRDLAVGADIVILGAGSLGSTEILLRSAENGLPLSSQLGRRFSANGDFIAFAHNCSTEVHGVGVGTRRQMGAVGPTITGAIWHAGEEAVEDRFVIEEGAIPGLLGKLLPAAFAKAALAVGKNTVGWWRCGERTQQKLRAKRSLLAGPYAGAVEHTQTFLVIGHDNSGGSMALEGDRLRIRWPGAGRQRFFQKIQKALEQATAAHDGIYVKQPTWIEVLGHDLVTVHPLGGSVMADSAETGVVDHRNRVFCSDRGTGVHDGLYVTCGAAIPGSVGVNPLLTITAVAERAMGLLVRERGWRDPGR